MIWAPGRNQDQGQLVAGIYQQASGVPCQHQAVLAGGLPGADKRAALARAGIEPTGYLTVSVDIVLLQMAARGLIPPVEGLSPLEAADLVHGEAQFLLKRAALRALADGRDIILSISMVSPPAVSSWLDTISQAGYAMNGIFADITVEESLRRSAAQRRRGQEDYRRGRGFGDRYIAPEAIRALAATSTPSRRRTAPAGPPDTAPAAGEVTDMIGSYHGGQLTLDELAQRFRARRWPAVPPVCPPGLEAAALAIDDPEPYVPGSFDDVVLAYDLGQLSDADYQTLAPAAAG